MTTIVHISREEGIEKYKCLPIPCEVNGIKTEVWLMNEDGMVYGLPIEEAQKIKHETN